MPLPPNAQMLRTPMSLRCRSNSCHWAADKGGGARGAIAPPILALWGKDATRAPPDKWKMKAKIFLAHYVLPLAVCKSFSPPPPISYCFLCHWLLIILCNHNGWCCSDAMNKLQQWVFSMSLLHNNKQVIWICTWSITSPSQLLVFFHLLLISRKLSRRIMHLTHPQNQKTGVLL